MMTHPVGPKQRPCTASIFERSRLRMRHTLLAWGSAIACAAALLPSASCARPEAGRPTLTVESRAQAGPTPPLLRIKKGRFSAYLLPESHVGSPLEAGPYFDQVVVPAARRSRTLVHERLDLGIYPGSPHWGRTCLDDHPEVAALGPQLTRRIVDHHRHSYWADLRRAWSEHGEAFAVENFTAFIGGRGLLLNFLELRSAIHPLVDSELAARQSDAPQVTAREHSAELSAHQRLANRAPWLRWEPIETVDDRAWAICQLTPTQQREALRRAIELFDETASRTHSEAPGSILRDVELGFAALRAQLRLAGADGSQPGGAHAGARASLGADWMKRSSGGPALDKLRFELRNERWAQRIDAHAQARRTGLIYVVGSHHLLDFEHFDGLLTLLKRRGFQIEGVR